MMKYQSITSMDFGNSKIIVRRERDRLTFGPDETVTIATASAATLEQIVIALGRVPGFISCRLINPNGEEAFIYADKKRRKKDA